MAAIAWLSQQEGRFNVVPGVSIIMLAIISFFFQLHSCFPCGDTNSSLLAKISRYKLSPVTLRSYCLVYVRDRQLVNSGLRLFYCHSLGQLVIMVPEQCVFKVWSWLLVSMSNFMIGEFPWNKQHIDLLPWLSTYKVALPFAGIRLALNPGSLSRQKLWDHLGSVVVSVKIWPTEFFTWSTVWPLDGS